MGLAAAAADLPERTAASTTGVEGDDFGDAEDFLFVTDALLDTVPPSTEARDAGNAGEAG